MATNFPTSLDSFTDPAATDPLNSPSHSGQHTDKNDAVEAIEAKVGINSSAVTTSIDYKLANQSTPVADGIDSGAAVGTAGAPVALHDHKHQVNTTDAPSGANITIDAAPSAAATGAVARAAHGHRANTYSSAAAAIGTAAAGTSGQNPSRGDHVHNASGDTPSTQAFGDAAATGTSAKAAQSDHKHAMPAAAITSSGHTMSTARLLGRTTAATGAIEEITVGSGLTMAAGTITANAGSGVATDAIWDAKGDLAAGTGADTAAKVTVGADDTILMADSAQSTGLKWVASGTPSTQAFGDAAAVGTADTFTRGDHKHAMPGSGGTIDNTLIANRTRYIWIGPGDWLYDDAVAGSSGTSPNLLAHAAFSEAGGRLGLYANFLVPEDWVAASTMSMTLVWFTTTSTGNVVWTAQVDSAASGQTPGSLTNLTSGGAGGIAIADSTTIKYSTITTWDSAAAATWTPAAAGDVLAINLERNAAHANDTATGAARLIGIRINYTADM